MKHPLSRALRSAGLDAVDVAAHLGVDPKTVDRWLGGRLPYPRHRAALVTLTGWAERDLWPGIDAREQTPDNDDILMTYAQRCFVPLETWRRLFNSAQREIGILAYSGLFLAEDAGVLATLRSKARAGLRVRIALGDVNSAHVAQRGADERIGDVMPARIANALVLFQPLTDEPGVSLRLHDTVLYNSIYCADDEMLANTHVYGIGAYMAPVFHLRRLPGGGLFDTFANSVQQTWEGARPVTDHDITGA